jgi:hypothetical protein
MFSELLRKIRFRISVRIRKGILLKVLDLLESVIDAIEWLEERRLMGALLYLLFVTLIGACLFIFVLK